MPLTGTLRDLSLANLVQVQCSEQHQAQVILTRGSHKGTLVFADGELIYARADDQVGENAVYELLTWEEGDFRVDTEPHSVERNVTASWSALLMEGLRLADEARAARDSALETHLRNLRGQQGLRGAFVLRPNGTVRADAMGEIPPEDSAAVLQIATSAEKLSVLLGAGAPHQVLLLSPTEKFWIQKLDNDFLAAWLDGRASVETLKASLQSFIH